MYVRVLSWFDVVDTLVTVKESKAAMENMYGGTPPSTVAPHGAQVSRFSVTLVDIVKSGCSSSG